MDVSERTWSGVSTYNAHVCVQQIVLKEKRFLCRRSGTNLFSMYDEWNFMGLL